MRYAPQFHRPSLLFQNRSARKKDIPQCPFFVPCVCPVFLPVLFHLWCVPSVWQRPLASLLNRGEEQKDSPLYFTGVKCGRPFRSNARQKNQTQPPPDLHARTCRGFTKTISAYIVFAQAGDKSSSLQDDGCDTPPLFLPKGYHPLDAEGDAFGATLLTREAKTIEVPL